MLAIEVNFLTERFVATAHHDRRAAEWPPHPARLFSALVAAWADDDAPSLEERQALEWLEAQDPPSIAASEAAARKVLTNFVPVNDTAVISTSWYDRRASEVGRLIDEIDAASEDSSAKSKKQAERLDGNLAKARDVSDQVTNPRKTNPKEAVKLLPDHRGKQAREFPSVTPDKPRVTYIWASVPDKSGTTKALDGLLGRVTRLGHSSSLVSCRLTSDPPEPTCEPGPMGEPLRSVRRGQLAALEREHERHEAVKPRSLPFRAVRYRPVEPDAPGDHLRPDTAGHLVVFEFRPSSRRFPATRAVKIASTLRDAIFHHAEDPIPEGLSGHRDDGSPVPLPHVGFLPLPYVGYAHADGRIMGAAVSIPDSLDEPSRRAVLRAVGTWESEAGAESTARSDQYRLRLVMGRSGDVDMKRLTGFEPTLDTLRTKTWSRPSRRWVSATPVALPTNPGPLSTGTAAARAKAWAKAEQAVVDSCRHVGLPEPSAVTVSLDPFIRGVRPAAHFPAFRQRGRDGQPVARRLVHASVTFNQPVAGPLALGAGRYFGLGLMRPVQDDDADLNGSDELRRQVEEEQPGG